MRRLFEKIVFSCAGLMICLNTATSTGAENQTLSPQKNALEICKYEPLNFEVLCDKNWSRQTEDGYVVYTISTDPHVQVHIGIFDRNMRFLEQISRNNTQLTEKYEPGFSISDDIINGIRAKRISAFGLDTPKSRRLDYFFIRRGVIFSIRFKVESPEIWDRYKFLFHELIRSFKFTDPPGPFN